MEAVGISRPRRVGWGTKRTTTLQTTPPNPQRKQQQKQQQQQQHQHQYHLQQHQQHQHPTTNNAPTNTITTNTNTNTRINININTNTTNTTKCSKTPLPLVEPVAAAGGHERCFLDGFLLQTRTHIHYHTAKPHQNSIKHLNTNVVSLLRYYRALRNAGRNLIRAKKKKTGAFSHDIFCYSRSISCTWRGPRSTLCWTYSSSSTEVVDGGKMAA